MYREVTFQTKSMDLVKIILLIDLSESFGRNLIRGISRYSDIYGPWSFCKMPPFYRETYGIEGILDFANEWGAHGIIGQFHQSEEISKLIDSGLFILAVDFREQFNQISNISGDYAKSGELAAEYFLSKGHKHFAFYGTHDTVWSREREKGYRDYLKAHGFDISTYAPNAVRSHNFWYYTPSPLQDWLLSLPKPIAIFACDDNRAEHLLESCKLAALNIPEEVAILGTDNDEIICQYANPPLSSIQQEEENGGYRAAALMARMIREKRIIKEDIILKPLRIITRRSTETLAIVDPYVKKSLLYIRENLDKPLHVSDLVKIVPLSRRGLEKRFSKVMGRSMYKEIQRLRMEKVISLLLDTELSVYEISMICGFPDSKNLSRQFSSLYKMTPIQFRKRNQS